MNMELIHLALTNISEFKNNHKLVEINAGINYNNYNRYIEGLMELGKNEKLLSNIIDMRNKIDELIIKGKVGDNNDDDIYVILSNCINKAINIQSKPYTDRSAQEICTFYNTYNNFNDIYNGM